MTPLSARTAGSLVALATLIGVILRSTAITSRSLWGDEIMSLAIASGHRWAPAGEEVYAPFSASYYRASLALVPAYYSERLAEVLRFDVQPPLYYMLLNLWLRLFGTSETALRSLSVLLSSACIPLLYVLGRRLVLVPVAAYSALIFAIAPFQVAFAQYNRPYALLGFLALLSTWTAVRLCRGEGGWRWLLGYAGAAVAGLYTHYLFVWVLGFHWILVSWSRRGDGRFLLRWAMTQLCIAAAMLPWVPIVLAQMRFNRREAAFSWFYWHSGSLSLVDLVPYVGRDVVMLLSPGKIRGLCAPSAVAPPCRLDDIVTVLSYVIPVLVLTVCAWRLIVHVRAWRRAPGPRPDAWLTCSLWGLCVFGGPLLADFLLRSHGVQHHRYFIAASGAVYLAVALGFMSIKRPRVRVTAMAGLVLFLLAGTGLYLRGASATMIYEQGAREVAADLDRSAAGNDLLLLLNPGPSPRDYAYYLRSDLDIALVNIPRGSAPPTDIPSQLERHSRGRSRVWYVHDDGPEVEANAAVIDWLRARYPVVETRHFKNLHLYSFAGRHVAR